MGLFDYLKKKTKPVADLYDSDDGFIKSGQVKLIDDVMAAEEKMDAIRTKKKGLSGYTQ
jgi:hypothetical protein